MTSTSNPPAMFTPMDLESSLGKIDDTTMSDVNEQISSNEPSTRTSSTYPFKQADMSIEQAESYPYPLSETDNERNERKSLTEDKILIKLIDQSVADTAEAQMLGCISDEEDEWSLDLIETEDEDPLSYLEEEAAKMTKSGLELEKIGDPLSFWEG
jgi:hypothetical protein